MLRNKLMTRIILLVAIIMIVFPECKNSSEKQSASSMNFTLFRDIPDVTEDEIAAIEGLKKQYASFVYGITPSTEAFINENNEIGGFNALFCEYLSELFDIKFKPEFIDYRKTHEVMTEGKIDFADEIKPTQERRQYLHLTENPIAQRTLVIVRLKDAPPISKIASKRPLRYAFLKNSGAAQDVASALEPGSYETVIIELADVYQTLKSGKADGFIILNISESSFDAYDDLIVGNFYPLIISPVSLTTGKSELSPIISCLDKALKNGDVNYLNDLYDRGYNEYKKNKFLKSLTKEEREYIKNHSTVMISAVNWFYPICFYNKYEKQWEGIAFDAFDEVAKITGINFTLGNGPDASWAEIYEKLESGEIPINPDLIYTADRAKRYVWSNHIYLSEKYALVSKQSFPDISLNKIPYSRIGLMKSMAYTEMFNKWFPNASNATMYETQDDAFNALDNGEIDLIMTGTNTLLSITNYYEYSNYKANFIFDSTIDYSLAFNKKETVLYSVIEKALQLVDMQKISKHWESKTYDYKSKLLKARQPWLIGMLILSFIILSLVLILLARSRNAGKRLEKLVNERTQELELESSKLKTMFNSSPDIIFCKDLDSRYIQCNKSYAEMYNVKEEAVVGKTDMEIFNYDLEAAEKFIEDDRKIMRGNQSAIIEESIILEHKGNKELFLETIKTPLIQNGEVIGIFGISRDITDRKAMEEEALSASRSKTAFLANMSHEMRTPMNVIVGLTDLMVEEDNPTINMKDNLKKISIAGNTLLGLINDVLDISKIEAGKLELKPVEYEMPSLLNDIIILNIIRIESKPIAFHLDINEDLPCSLYGDDLRIKQIINNLLSNAFKYTQKGTVTLGISCEHGDAKDVWMSVYVSDTGIGIRKEDLDKLFTDYNQLDIQANRRIEGTGLGLSITKMLVEHMNGEISVESEYGKSTTFRLRIRQGYVSDKVIGMETTENLRSFRYAEDKRKAAQKLVRPDLSYAKVLVVDDMPNNLDVAAALLGKYKMQVDCVISGQEAIDRIHTCEPVVYDAIFMDHMMPGIDGVEATAKIRSLGTKYAMTIPIIALTANAIAGNEQMFLSNDFQAFLAKPINVLNLDAIVQRWVRDKSRE